MTRKKESAILIPSESGSERIHFLIYQNLKGATHMSYCPYCGADYQNGAFSFCPVCGNPLLESGCRQEQAKRKPKNPKAGPRKKKKKRSRREKQSECSYKPKQDPCDDGYDGYYDDVLPSDEGEIRQGLDKYMIKRIAGLLTGVLIAIIACVVLMYLI